MDATVEWNRTIRRRIYLLRHGDVSYFDEHGKPFRPATVPLNEEGRLQAEAAGRVLAEIPLDRVVSSDLVRSSETANLVIGGRRLRLETSAEFREIEPGLLADIPTDAVEQVFCPDSVLQFRHDILAAM